MSQMLLTMSWLPEGLGWQEISGVALSCFVIFGSYGLKELLSKKPLEHITRHETDKPSE